MTPPAPPDAGPAPLSGLEGAGAARPEVQTEGDIDVWVVEDNAHMRETVAELLDGRPGMRCGLAAGSCEEALDRLEGGDVPDVVFMDLGLPGIGGLDGIGRVKSVSPSTHVVVFTVHDDDDRVFEALCAGASGYLLKPAAADEITGAVRTTVRGGAPMNAFVARRVLDLFTDRARPKADYGLTAREREVLHHLVDGRTQGEIAEVLFISPHTVDTHVRNVYAKLHVRSRGGAVAKAVRERLL